MSDLDINFEPHPITGDVMKVSDEKSITQSIKSWVLTAFYERKFWPNLGCQTANVLFENYSESLTEYVLTKSIENVIRYQEPRAQHVKVEVEFVEGDNAIYASISYLPVNALNEVTVRTQLQRIR